MANLSNINNKFLFTDGDFLLIGGATANSISATESGVAIKNSNAATLSLQNSATNGKNHTLWSNTDGSFNITDVGVATRFTIASGGNVGIGLTNPSDYTADKLVISVSDDSGMTLVSGTTDTAYIRFADGTSAADQANFISHDHNTNTLTVFSQAKVSIGILEAEVAYFTDTAFYVDKSTTIDDTLTVNGNATFAGTVLIDGVSSYTGLEVKGVGGSRPEIKWSNANNGNLGNIFGTETNDLVIATGSSGTTALTLDSSQNATFAGSVTAPSGTITGSLTTNGLLVNTSASGNAKIVGVDQAYARLAIDNVNGQEWNLIAGAAGASNSGFGIYNADSGQTALQIDSSGNSTFTGSVRVTNATQSNYWLYNAAKTNGFLLGRSLASNDGQDFFIFDTVANSASMTIDSSQNATFAGNITTGAGSTVSGMATLRLENGVNKRNFSCDSAGNLDISNAANNTTIFHLQDNALTLGTSIGQGSLSLYSGSITSSGNATFAGNVGIGVTSPNGKLSLAGGSNINSQNSILYIDTNSYYASGADRYITSSTAARYFQSNGEHIWSNAASGTAGNAISFAERMRIESDGDVLLTEGNLTMSGNTPFIVLSNTAETESGITFVDSADASQSAKITYDSGDNNLRFYNNASTERMSITSGGNVKIGSSSTAPLYLIPSSDGFASPLIQFNKTDTAPQTALQFLTSGVTRGSITYSGSSTSYNTTSDYRLKEDLQDFNGLDKVSKISVYDFKWKTDESRSYGVMAHELQEVLPDAVTGEKDAEEMQGVDYAKIVPLLVKSIQELKAKVDKLEQECKCKN